MKKTLKTLIAAILAIITTLGATPAFAAESEIIYSDDGKILIEYPETKTDKEFTVPDGVVQIGENAFAGNTYIEKVNLPDTLESIEHCAFYDCTALKTIVLPASVKSFCNDDNYSNSSFYGCTNLEEIKVNAENKTYTSVDGVVFSKDGKKLVYYPCGKKDDTYYVPSTTEIIGWASFCGHKFIKNVIIPSGVTEIEGWAFLGSSIETIEIPKTMKKIGWSSIDGCDNLRSVYYAGNEKEFYNIDINEYDVDLSQDNASLFEAELVCEDSISLVERIILHISLFFKSIIDKFKYYI